MTVCEFLVTTLNYLFLLPNNYLNILELMAGTLILSTRKKNSVKNIYKRLCMRKISANTDTFDPQKSMWTRPIYLC